MTMPFTHCSYKEMKMEKDTNNDKYDHKPRTCHKLEMSRVRCDLCAASFADIDSITNHLDSHIDIKSLLVPYEKQLTCDICDKSLQCNCQPGQVCGEPSYK